jgi:hypothetical protein
MVVGWMPGMVGSDEPAGHGQYSEILPQVVLGNRLGAVVDRSRQTARLTEQGFLYRRFALLPRVENQVCSTPYAVDRMRVFPTGFGQQFGG